MRDRNTPFRIDILNLEIESLKYGENPQVTIACAYYAVGKANRVKVSLPVTDELQMTHRFYDALLGSFKSSALKRDRDNVEQYEITKKAQLENELINFFLKIKAGADKARTGRLSEFDLAMIITNRLDFYNPEFSLNNKSLKEKVEILLNKAKGDIQDGYYIPAKDLLEKILILDNDNKEAFSLLGACHRELGNLEKAEGAFKRWLELSEPDEPKPYFNYGDVLISLKKYDEAVRVFEAYLRIFPDDFDGIIELAQVKCLMGEDAGKLLEKACGINPIALKDELLRNFIFAVESEPTGEYMDIKLAAAFLGSEPEVIRDLIEKNIIPHQFLDDEPVLYEKELERWAGIANRFELFPYKFVIDRSAVEKLKFVRRVLPSIGAGRPGRPKKMPSRTEKRKRILEDLGQQKLFEDK